MVIYRINLMQILMLGIFLLTSNFAFAAGAGINSLPPSPPRSNNNKSKRLQLAPLNQQNPGQNSPKNHPAIPKLPILLEDENASLLNGSSFNVAQESPNESIVPEENSRLPSANGSGSFHVAEASLDGSIEPSENSSFNNEEKGSNKPIDSSVIRGQLANESSEIPVAIANSNYSIQFANTSSINESKEIPVAIANSNDSIQLANTSSITEISVAIANSNDSIKLAENSGLPANSSATENSMESARILHQTGASYNEPPEEMPIVMGEDGLPIFGDLSPIKRPTEMQHRSLKFPEIKKKTVDSSMKSNGQPLMPSKNAGRPMPKVNKNIIQKTIHSEEKTMSGESHKVKEFALSQPIHIVDAKLSSAEIAHSASNAAKILPITEKVDSNIATSSSSKTILVQSINAKPLVRSNKLEVTKARSSGQEIAGVGDYEAKKLPITTPIKNMAATSQSSEKIASVNTKLAKSLPSVRKAPISSSAQSKAPILSSENKGSRAKILPQVNKISIKDSQLAKQEILPLNSLIAKDHPRTKHQDKASEKFSNNNIVYLKESNSIRLPISNKILSNKTHVSSAKVATTSIYSAKNIPTISKDNLDIAKYSNSNIYRPAQKSPKILPQVLKLKIAETSSVSKNHYKSNFDAKALPYTSKANIGISRASSEKIVSSRNIEPKLPPISRKIQIADTSNSSSKIMNTDIKIKANYLPLPKARKIQISDAKTSSWHPVEVKLSAAKNLPQVHSIKKSDSEASTAQVVTASGIKAKILPISTKVNRDETKKSTANISTSFTSIAAKPLPKVAKMSKDDTKISGSITEDTNKTKAKALPIVKPMDKGDSKATATEPLMLAQTKSKDIQIVAKSGAGEAMQSAGLPMTATISEFSSNYPPSYFAIDSAGGGGNEPPISPLEAKVEVSKAAKAQRYRDLFNYDDIDAASHVIGQRLDLVRGSMVGVAAGDDRLIQKGLWFKGIHSYSDQKTRGNIVGYNVRQKGMILGADAEVFDGSTLGFSYGRLTSKGSSKAIIGDTEKTKTDLYSVYFEEKLKPNLMLNGRIHYGKVHINNNIDYKTATSSGKTNGHLWKGTLEAIYGINMKHFVISPKIQITHDRHNVGKYIQNINIDNRVKLPIEVAPRKGEKWTATAGLGAKKDFKVKSIYIVPKLHFNVRHILSKSKSLGSINIGEQDLESSILEFGNHDRTTYNVGGYINANRSDIFEIGVGYDYHFRKGFKNHSSYVSMFLKF